MTEASSNLSCGTVLSAQRSDHRPAGGPPSISQGRGCGQGTRHVPVPSAPLRAVPYITGPGRAQGLISLGGGGVLWKGGQVLLGMTELLSSDTEQRVPKPPTGSREVTRPPLQEPHPGAPCVNAEAEWQL